MCRSKRTGQVDVGKGQGRCACNTEKRFENKQFCNTCQGNRTHANTRNHACKMRHCSSKTHPNLQCEPVRGIQRNALQIAQKSWTKKGPESSPKLAQLAHRLRELDDPIGQGDSRIDMLARTSNSLPKQCSKRL